MLKTLIAGESSGTQLAESLRLPYSVLDALIQHARVEKLVEVRGAERRRHGRLPLRPDRPRPRPRDAVPRHQPLRRAGAGAARAVQRLRARLHGGASVGRSRACSRKRLRAISSSATAMFDQLGPAVNSGKSLFLYGAPGNGKTVVAEGIGRALGSDMHVPHAIDVDGQTITDVRSGQPRAGVARSAPRPASSPAPCTIGAGSRSGVRSSWSAAS